MKEGKEFVTQSHPRCQPHRYCGGGAIISAVSRAASQWAGRQLDGRLPYLLCEAHTLIK